MEYAALSDPLSPSASNAFCTNMSAYDFDYDELWRYEKAVCTFPSESTMLRKTPTGVFVITHTTESKEVILKPSMAGVPCELSISRDGMTLPLSSKRAGHCRYSTSRELMPVGGEGARIYFQHQYEAGNGDDGINPQTFVRLKDSTEDFMIFDKGVEVKFLLKDMLDAFGIDLDMRMNEQPGKFHVDKNLTGVGASKDIYPYLRLTGLVLDVHLQYHNRGLESSSKKQPSSTTNIYCIMEVTPRLDWTSLGHGATMELLDVADPMQPTFASPGGSAGVIVDQYSYGVRIDVRASGMVGNYSRQVMITVVLNGIVLMGTAGTITRLIAQYGMGDKSSIYANFITEKMKGSREYARFTLQALVAATAFKQYDVDGSGGLSLQELTTQIGEQFRGIGLKESTAEVLASFIIDESNDSTGVEPQAEEGEDGESGEGVVTMSEWMQLVTSDLTDLGVLRRLLRGEHPSMLGEYLPLWLTGDLPMRERAQKAMRRQERRKSRAASMAMGQPATTPKVMLNPTYGVESE
mmetsp:Transcript_13111/g.43193  ORF Transcript_13111/g.43193 Transcript_13111/m.43193 type:complete len:522 (-) Transcript_13111:165-1730(-)